MQKFLDSAEVTPAVSTLRPDYRALLLAVDGITPAPSDAESEALLKVSRGRIRTCVDRSSRGGAIDAAEAPLLVPTHFTLAGDQLLIHLARPNPEWATPRGRHRGVVASLVVGLLAMTAGWATVGLVGMSHKMPLTEASPRKRDEPDTRSGRCLTPGVVSVGAVSIGSDASECWCFSLGGLIALLAAAKL